MACDDEEEVDLDDIACVVCGDELAPPIYYCGKKCNHVHCEKCIFQQIQCSFCTSIEWTRFTKAEDHFDPTESAKCFLCGFEGDKLAYIAHSADCPFTQTLRCPLEDPYCPVVLAYTGHELEHVIKDHVNPIRFPDNVQDPDIIDPGHYQFSNDHKPNPIPDNQLASGFPPMDIDGPKCSVFPKDAPPHSVCDLSPYCSVPRLAMVENEEQFVMVCNDINHPGFFRHNVLLTKQFECGKTVGFICSLQHYERSLGLDKFRVSVICLGPYKTEDKFIFNVKFTCGPFEREAKIKVLNVLENMHKVCPNDVMEIHNKDFNSNYEYGSCNIEFKLEENTTGQVRKLNLEPEPLIIF